MVKTINVVVLGESSVGKSTLIKKFQDSGAEVTPQDPNAYWDWQQSPTSAKKEVTFNGNSYSLEVTEVPGSKGRMSNHYEVRQQASTGEPPLSSFLFGFLLLLASIST